MKQFKYGLFVMITLMLVGCIKIPIGDGKSMKLSKEGVTVSDKDGNESELSINDEEGSFSISTGENGEEINVNIGADSELPEGFPKDIPIADDAIIIQAADMSEGNDRYYMVMYLTNKPIDQVTDIYDKYISSSGYELMNTGMDSEQLFEHGETFQGMKGEDQYFMVTVLQDESEEDGDMVTVSITYANVEE